MQLSQHSISAAAVPETGRCAVQATFVEYARSEGHSSNSRAAEAFVRYGPNTFQVSFVLVSPP